MKLACPKPQRVEIAARPRPMSFAESERGEDKQAIGASDRCDSRDSRSRATDRWAMTD